jgi:hypothetical protein
VARHHDPQTGFGIKLQSSVIAENTCHNRCAIPRHLNPIAYNLFIEHPVQFPASRRSEV